jgi:hypothetical protein
MRRVPVMTNLTSKVVVRTPGDIRTGSAPISDM